MFPGILPSGPPVLANVELIAGPERPARTANPPVFEVRNDPSTPSQRRPSTYVPTRVGEPLAHHLPNTGSIQWPPRLETPRRASAAAPRNDSIFPGHLDVKEKRKSVSSRKSMAERRESVAVFLKTRSWSLFMEPPPDPELAQPIAPRRHWAWRAQHDVMLRCVLGIAFGLAATLVVFGCIYLVVHRKMMQHDKFTFVCGYDRSGPKCPTRLAGEEEALQKADYVDGGMIGHYLEEHCVWRRPSWKCGPNVGEADTGVFPEGTFLQPLGRVDDD